MDYVICFLFLYSLGPKNCCFLFGCVVKYPYDSPTWLMEAITLANKKRFLLFDTQREGKGVSKSDVIKEPNLKKFFLIYKENFSNRLLFVNLLMILGNFPLIFLFLSLIGVGQKEFFAPGGNLYSVLQGIFLSQGTETPADLALFGINGIFTQQHANTAVNYVFYGISALTLFTWGPVSVGTTYILRNLASSRPIFFWSDFFDTIRKNWKQGLFYGMIDLLILVILPFNMVTILQSNGGDVASFFFWTTVVLFLAYFVMRWYVYLQIVTFDMPIFRIISNAMKFILIGIKRNLMALLGAVLLLGLTLLFLLSFNGVTVVLTLGIVLFCLFSGIAFMGIYAAWHKIDEIMVIHTPETDPDAEDPSIVASE